MQYYPFDSRNTIYKSVYGAVASGENLKLRLLLHKDACVYNAFLRLTNDADGSTTEIELIPEEWLDEYRFFDTELCLNEGLYWYDFRYTSAHGEFFVVKSRNGLGIVSQCQGDRFQLTVYDKDFTTPDWLKGGIIYQIFPDRFYNSGAPKKDVPDDRYICDDWNKQPEYKQNGADSNIYIRQIAEFCLLVRVHLITSVFISYIFIIILCIAWLICSLFK